MNKNTRDANVTNKSMRLLMDKAMIDILDTQRNKLKKLNGKPTPAFEEESKKRIKKFLVSQDLPLSWLEPLYNTIFHKYVDLPLGDGMHIEIDGEVLTENTSFIYTDIDIFEEGDIPNGYSIVVTRDVSKSDLINFIKDNEITLQKLQRNLKLPKDPTVRSKRTLYALAVIKMRDEQNKTFSEITDLLEEAISNDGEMGEKEKKEMLTMVSTEENVRKNLYDRFKKDYLRLKNSSKK